MTLPASIERCPGRQPQAWPFPGTQQANPCDDCARRRQGIADYMAGANVAWFDKPPSETPCPEQLKPKR